MRNLIISLFLVFFISASVRAQVIKGRVVDSNTQEGIAYTNIGVEGTFYGTASDSEGFFELKVPDEFKNEKLFFSAVGYGNMVLRIPELLKRDFTRIQLVEQTYDIDTIDVAAQSRVLFRVIKTAAAKVPENFYHGPLGLKLYFEETKQVAGALEQKREAVVQLYDESGYASPSITDAFSKRHFKFSEVKKNFESYSIPAAKTGFEELLEMDIARLSNTIFDEKLLNDFDLQLEGISKFNDDSVWIISYKTSKADLAHTGDFYATQLDGKIYISKNNYEVIRNECMIDAEKNHPHNRSLATKKLEQSKVNYHYTATYNPFNGKYAVNYLDCEKTYLDQDNKEVSYSRKASVLELNTTAEKIQGKDYFENADYVESFWNSFKRPK
ncbi:carboxypeptidase-like regulatory domain-containing protein [Sunxiuqinia indica]|uniref:carboxypeptidase-like regulatory domain-containing protein n=1 Tax=Sunxiuqinia indica TaxID=2692584 RepID=UPI00135BAB70|nr:carboxypeptidase-like regulatory domain-containing protein [Sunxiuqinia indica]